MRSNMKFVIQHQYTRVNGKRWHTRFLPLSIVFKKRDSGNAMVNEYLLFPSSLQYMSLTHVPFMYAFLQINRNIAGCQVIPYMYNA